MDVRMKFPDAFMKHLKKSTGAGTSVEVINNALALYKWAIEQKKNKRKILSSNIDGENPVELEIPSLSWVSSSE